MTSAVREAAAALEDIEFRALLVRGDPLEEARIRQLVERLEGLADRMRDQRD